MKKWLLISGGVLTSVASGYSLAWLHHCCQGVWHEPVTVLTLTFTGCAGVVAALVFGLAE